jgi:uncharacterized protein
MMIQKILIISAMMFPLTFFSQKAGQECFPDKALKLVYDEPDVIDDAQQRMLENKLVLFADSTSNQIAVVVVNDLCGMDKAQYAIELGELWGVGQEKEDNGIVVLVKVKTPGSRGEAFIAVGRGLEGAIPDAIALEIIEREMIPQFRNNDYSGGVNAAVTVLMDLAKGEYNSDAYSGKSGKPLSAGAVVFIILGIIAVIALALSVRVYQVMRYARINNLGFWIAWALLNNMNRQHHGSWNDFRRGRGGFGGWSGGGGFGGGGFGGFGGGSFGGGGAGGSW